MLSLNLGVCNIISRYLLQNFILNTNERAIAKGEHYKTIYTIILNKHCFTMDTFFFFMHWLLR